MADLPPPDPTTAPDLRGQAAQQIAGWMDVADAAQLQKWLTTIGHQVLVDIVTFVLKYGAKLGAELGTILYQAENESAAEFSQLASVAIADLFGVDAPVTPGRGGRGSRTATANAVGDMLIKAFSGAAQGGGGPATEIVPSMEPAKNFLSTMTQLSLEGWLEGWIMEALSIGQMETFGELDDKIAHTLGLGRASAAVHGPLVRHLITTPLDWEVSKKYRPALLGATTLARLIARNPDQKDKWLEDLRRQGFSEERIAALLREAQHYFSAADVRTFEYRGYWSMDKARQHLMDQGYAEQDATDALRLEGLKTIDQLEGQEAAAIISGYVAGDIDRAQLISMLGTSVSVETDRALYAELADVKRAANTQHLSPAQVAAMVKSGVLTYIDYRAALARLNFTPEAIDALDLQLRYEVDKEKTIEQHRADQEAARKKAADEREAARQQRLKEIAAQKEIASLGPVSKLEDAAVRGLIPLARVQEVYDATFPAGTVAILMDELTARRQDYLDRQAAAEEAKKRAALKGLSAGELERAVYAGVISVADFARQIGALGLAPADVAILTATVQATLDARIAAQKARDEAAAAAKIKHIDLAKVELLVRRGHRTMADYRALLASLGYDAGSIAAMAELLQIQIDDDARAAAIRAAAEKKAGVKTLTLEQVRRAIIIGARDIATFTPWLLQQGYTSDDSATLLAELQADVAEATAARARRAQADRAVQAGRSPLADVRRAARLGLIPIDTYLARLTADGYTADDLAIETDLLVAEMGRDRTLADAAAAADAATPTKGLTLAQLQAAVLAGVAPITDYTARALQLGFSSDDAQILTDTLQATLDTTAAARARKQQLADADATRELGRADMEKAVKQGLKTIDDYAAWLPGNGYAADDAALLVAELRITLGLPGDDPTSGG